MDPFDDELANHLGQAVVGYALGGNRLHGRDLAPAVRHVGHKMAKVSKYLQLARAGYYVGKKALGYLSSKQTKKMPPLPTPPKTPRKKPYGRVAGRDVIRKGKGYTILSSVKRRLNFKKGGRKNSYPPGPSSGRIKKSAGKRTLYDQFAKKGIITTRETGTVVVSNSLNTYQTFVFHQATSGSDQIVVDLGLAWAKAIVTQCFGQTVESFGSIITFGNGRLITLSFKYRLNPAAIIQNFFFSIAAGGTIQTLANSISTNVKALIDVNPDLQFTTLDVYYEVVLTTPPVGTEVIGKYDLKRMVLDMYAESNLKVQNRSVSSAGSTEADEVDNVPLQGRSYDGSGNYFSVEDTYYYPPIGFQQNMNVNGHNTQPWLEPPPLSQLKGMKTSGKITLDPGHLKTSNLKYRRKLQLNTLMMLIGKSSTNYNITKLGKQRVLVYEKMLQAVATNAENGIRIAYEIELKTAFSVYMPKLTTTTEIVSISVI